MTEKEICHSFSPYVLNVHGIALIDNVIRRTSSYVIAYHSSA